MFELRRECPVVPERFMVASQKPAPLVPMAVGARSTNGWVGAEGDRLRCGVVWCGVNEKGPPEGGR